MLLQTLLAQFDSTIPSDPLKDIEIRAVREDSRLVGPGDLFVARPGARTDGRRFIADAAARGAVAVVSASPIADCPLPQVVTPDINAASILANLCFQNPSRTVDVLGVTGTNGKTTIAYLVRHILASVHRRCGMIGTVEIDDGHARRPADMTTPGAADLAEMLAAMRDHGCRACALEVSSHALEQGRVAGISFAGAAFTNLTGDHLDYHKTMDAYADAKARLFHMLPHDAVAVVNADDDWSQRLVRDCKARVVSFGLVRTAAYAANSIRITAQGSRFTMATPAGDTDVRMSLIGRHNIANALAAAALVAEIYHLPPRQIAAALANAPGAPGRLQPVRCGQHFAVFVDYAHTDDGLENVLIALRPLTTGRLRVVFGCGGDRDHSKRPRMARVAQRLADVIYLTSDNPRTEDPRAIIDEIITGFSADVFMSGDAREYGPARHPDSPKAKPVFVEADRRSAIRRALRDAEEGDVVLLAGKGHENYQIVGTEKRHFDDVEEATQALHARATAA